MQPETSSYNRPRIISVLALMVLLAIGLAWFIRHKTQLSTSSTQLLKTAPQVLITAKEGQLVPGFPKELIISTSTAIYNSQQVLVHPTSGTTNYIFSAYFNLDASIITVYKAYTADLVDRGYKITKTDTSNSKEFTIFASKFTKDVLKLESSVVVTITEINHTHSKVGIFFNPRNK
jgi:hypothetical protein